MKTIKLLTLSLISTAFLSFTPPNKKYIIIDAGHGGNDNGVVYGGFSEKEITLTIAKEIQALTKNQGKYEVILTRDTDSYPSLAERTAKINELAPEMVISLHINRSPAKETDANGQEIYIQNNEGSKKLADRISKKFDVRTIAEKNLHILRESKSPAVLVELGFMNNTKDREYMVSEKGQKEIAKKFAEVISEY